MTVLTLRTPRLTLRDLCEGDLDAVVRHCNNYAISKWLTKVAHPYTRPHAEEFMQAAKAGDLGLLWVITQDGDMIGVVSAGDELGYWLAEAYWRQGYVTEAAEAAINHVFSDERIDTLRSSHFVGNQGSQRVLEKLGFVDMGDHVHYSLARQAEVPGRSMLLTRADWEWRYDA